MDHLSWLHALQQAAEVVAIVVTNRKASNTNVSVLQSLYRVSEQQKIIGPRLSQRRPLSAVQPNAPIFAVKRL